MEKGRRQEAELVQCILYIVFRRTRNERRATRAMMQATQAKGAILYATRIANSSTICYTRGVWYRGAFGAGGSKEEIWLTPLIASDLEDFGRLDLNHRLLRGGRCADANAGENFPHGRPCQNKKNRLRCHRRSSNANNRRSAN